MVYIDIYIYISSCYRHREPISVVGEVTEMVKRNPYGIYIYIYPPATGIVNLFR